MSSDQPFLFGEATQVVTILDDDEPTIFSLPTTALEVSEGAPGFNVVVTRSSADGAAEIGLSFTGSATSGGENPDFTRIGGTNMFADGETEKLITYWIEQDTLREPDETVDFALSIASSDQPSLLDDATQAVTILDDDEATYGGPILGGSLDDLLQGTQQADVIIGAGGADTLWDGGGGDTISGGAGAENIRGNGGADVIRGGGGADTFQFRASDRNDTVLDFRQGQDMIEIMSGVNRFEALRIEQDGADVLIGFGAAGQVRVVTDNAGAFDESDFIF